MDAREARTEFQAGRLPTEQLLELLERQERLIQRLHTEVERLKQRLAQYEPDVRQEPTPTEPSQDSPSASYSLDAEDRRRRPRRRRRKSPGRRPTPLKFAEAQCFEDIYPDCRPPADCQLLRERAVWRLRDGRAVRVGYRIFGRPGGPEPSIPGVTPRCEYGIEILVVLAFLVYVIGLSLDKACAVLAFFCQLPLAKSQADALLRQLARHWEGEFDLLCALLAHAAVVYMDETGWKVGNEGCALWTFASAGQRVFLFGCHKDAATLDAMLPPEVFHGIGVSDDAAVYRGRFERAQKCWAHLLRKAIRLALLYPRKKKYQRFLDELLALYRDAKRAAADGRLGAAGRQDRVTELENRLCGLCLPYLGARPAELPPPERDFRNLASELTDLLLDGELFTFVLHPEVEATNNFTERLQRGPALDRKAGRTNKTAAGAHRRSVIVSVLESLRANLESFTLSRVLEEVQRWMAEGVSLFRRQCEALLDATAATVPDTG
jgi:transposase